MKKALIVGIDEYPNAPLQGCVNDASAVAELLKTNGDGAPNFDVSLKINVKTKAEFLDLIESGVCQLSCHKLLKYVFAKKAFLLSRF